MGIKLLSLKMIPWRFHVMGNTACHRSDGPPPSPSDTKSGSAAGGSKAAPSCIKLVRADGRVEVYHRPVTASELMDEHPKHLVCRSDAFTIGQLIPALPAEEQLQPGHAYFLLPVQFFQSVLSFVTLASSFATVAKGRPSLLRRPFEVHKTPSGKLQIRISDEFIQRMQEAQEGGNGRGEVGGGGGGGGRVCTTATLEKDYQQLVVGSRERQWKPKLETIRESEKRKGKLVAEGDGALHGIRRRRKEGHQVEPQSHVQEQQLQQKQHQKRPKKEKKKKKGHQAEPHDHEQKQQPQQKPQKKQKQKVSVVAKHQNSPTCSKSKGKNVVACHL